MIRKNYELLKLGAQTSTTDVFICRAVFDLVMDTSPALYVEKKLWKKNGEEVGIAFVRIEEAKSGMEGLVWAEDDEDELQEGGFDMKLVPSNAMRSSDASKVEAFARIAQ